MFSGREGTLFCAARGEMILPITIGDLRMIDFSQTLPYNKVIILERVCQK
jgi:hypothetical protein